MLGNDADRIMTTPMKTTVVTQNTARGYSMPAPRPADGRSATREAGVIRLGPSTTGMLPGIGYDAQMLPGMGALDNAPGWLLGLAGAAVGYFAGRQVGRKKSTKQAASLGMAAAGAFLGMRMGG